MNNNALLLLLLRQGIIPPAAVFEVLFTMVGASYDGGPNRLSQCYNKAFNRYYMAVKDGTTSETKLVHMNATTGLEGPQILIGSHPGDTHYDLIAINDINSPLYGFLYLLFEDGTSGTYKILKINPTTNTVVSNFIVSGSGPNSIAYLYTKDLFLVNRTALFIACSNGLVTYNLDTETIEGTDTTITNLTDVTAFSPVDDGSGLPYVYAAKSLVNEIYEFSPTIGYYIGTRSLGVDITVGTGAYNSRLIKSVRGTVANPTEKIYVFGLYTPGSAYNIYSFDVGTYAHTSLGSLDVSSTWDIITDGLSVIKGVIVANSVLGDTILFMYDVPNLGSNEVQVGFINNFSSNIKLVSGNQISGNFAIMGQEDVSPFRYKIQSCKINTTL